MTIDADPLPLTTSEFFALRRRIAEKGYRGLTQAERDDLLARTKRKERRAEELFVMLHERFVQSIVAKDVLRRMGTFRIDKSEAMQEGRLAILRAVKDYDQSRGAFSTYLFWHLRSCNRFDNSGDPLIWMGRMKLGRGRRIEKDKIVPLRNLVCLDEPIDGEETSSPSEMISSEERTPEELFADLQTDRDEHLALQAGLAMLSARERFIIESRFSDETPSLEDVGQALNLSRERVRQIEAAALEKLRKRLQKTKADPASSQA